MYVFLAPFVEITSVYDAMQRGNVKGLIFSSFDATRF